MLLRAVSDKPREAKIAVLRAAFPVRSSRIRVDTAAKTRATNIRSSTSIVIIVDVLSRVAGASNPPRQQRRRTGPAIPAAVQTADTRAFLDINVVVER